MNNILKRNEQSSKKNYLPWILGGIGAVGIIGIITYFILKNKKREQE